MRTFPRDENDPQTPGTSDRGVWLSLADKVSVLDTWLRNSYEPDTLLGTFISKHSLQNVNPNVPKTRNLISKSMINALRAMQGANGTHGREEGNEEK